MHLNFRFGETPDCPAVSMGQFVKSSVPLKLSGSLPMPVIPICLNNEFHGLENKVWLESAEHRLVHLESEPPFLKLVSQPNLNTGGFLWLRVLSKACLPNLLPRLGGMFVAKVVLIANVSCANLLQQFRPVSLPLLKSCLAQMLLVCFRHGLAQIKTAYSFTLCRSGRAPNGLTTPSLPQRVFIVSHHRLSSVLDMFRRLLTPFKEVPLNHMLIIPH